jgi:hypothetical protein
MANGCNSRCAGTPEPCRRRSPGTSGRVLATVASCVGLLLTACVPSRGDPVEVPGPESSANRDESLRESLGDSPAACVAPAGGRVQDIDPEDSPVKPWQKPAGEELVVEFETGQLSDRYVRLVAEAAAIWSESPCLNAVAVATCSSDANCVAIEEDGNRSRGTDGEMHWRGRGAYMESASITVYTRPLGRATDNGALATIVHEMGHTLGLDHRLERSDVMNSVTDDHTNPVPDAVDFSNLAAIYGS